MEEEASDSSKIHKTLGALAEALRSGRRKIPMQEGSVGDLEVSRPRRLVEGVVRRLVEGGGQRLGEISSNLLRSAARARVQGLVPSSSRLLDLGVGTRGGVVRLGPRASEVVTLGSVG